MKLTVGPLPAGVYWRRRAIVGGALLIAMLLLWTQCSGPDPKRTPASAQSPSVPVSPAADPAPTIQTPTTDDPAGSAPASTTSAPAVASTLPVCADADLSLVAAPEQPVQFRGAYLKFTLKIKNTSTRECTRDLGADFQELYLQVGALKMWSSDQCDAPHGSQPTTLKPSIEVSFSTTWNGKATNNGCANREVPPAGKYELVGRLDTKLSSPVQVQLT
jgi:hypothetical protein